MSAKSIIATVTGFLAHHVTDLSVVHSALSELVSVSPIDSQDKERINSALGTIETSAKNINDFLQGTKVTGADVTLKESDIVEALSNYLNSDAGKAALEAAVKSAEGNGNA